MSELPSLLQEVFEQEFGCKPGEDLAPSFEQSLGAIQADRGYWSFPNGCSNQGASWQVLSVNRVQPGGSNDLNRRIKDRYRAARFNDAIESKNAPGFWRRPRWVEPTGPEQITYGDKVLCVRNHSRTPYVYGENGDRETEYIANGEVGIVTGQMTYPTGKPTWVNVEFSGRPDRSFGFSSRDFREDASPTLELAYAVTVHKAQGSQFEVVILVVPAKSRLLSCEMIYTALTRQMKRIWILHQGGFERVLALRHRVFSDVEARLTNLLHESDPKAAPTPVQLPPGLKQNARGFLEDQLVHRTIRGELVSSKSELAIANILHALEVEGKLTYEVEPPLPFTDNARGRWADFRIRARGEEWYWEHCGRLDLPSYRER